MLKTLKYYFGFKGRSSGTEFGVIYLLLWLLNWAMESWLFAGYGTPEGFAVMQYPQPFPMILGAIAILWFVGHLWLLLAVSVRRMHDCGWHGGVGIFILAGLLVTNQMGFLWPVVGLFVWVLPAQSGPNKYGTQSNTFPGILGEKPYYPAAVSSVRTSQDPNAPVAEKRINFKL